MTTPMRSVLSVVCGNDYNLQTTNPLLFSSLGGIEKVLKISTPTNELDHLMGINQSLEQIAGARLKEMEGQMPVVTPALPDPPSVSRLCISGRDSRVEPNPDLPVPGRGVGFPRWEGRGGISASE